MHVNKRFKVEYKADILHISKSEYYSFLKAMPLAFSHPTNVHELPTLSPANRSEILYVLE